MNKDYLEDAQGRQVPLSIIKPMDLKRHEAVMSIMKETFAERERLIEFKRGIWLRVQNFLQNRQKIPAHGSSEAKRGMLRLRAMTASTRSIAGGRERYLTDLIEVPPARDFANAKLAENISPF